MQVQTKYVSRTWLVLVVLYHLERSLKESKHIITTSLFNITHTQALASAWLLYLKYVMQDVTLLTQLFLLYLGVQVMPTLSPYRKCLKMQALKLKTSTWKLTWTFVHKYKLCVMTSLDTTFRNQITSTTHYLLSQDFLVE